MQFNQGVVPSQIDNNNSILLQLAAQVKKKIASRYKQQTEATIPFIFSPLILNVRQRFFVRYFESRNEKKKKRQVASREMRKLDQSHQSRSRVRRKL